MLREFFLKNANGNVINLNDFQFEFIHSVKGLGHEKDLKVKQIGSHFEVVQSIRKMNKITGAVHFTAPDAYRKCFDFVQFCEVEPLTLIYNPERYTQTEGQDVKGYRRECILTKFTKEGYNKGYGEMSCPVEFTCLTPWYETVYAQSEPTEVEQAVLYDNYKFDDIRFSSITSNTVEINSDSRLDTGSPCRLRIYGPITNPAWTLYINNVDSVRGSVTATIPSGNYLEIDTINGRSIKQYDSNGVLVNDLYQQADFNETRFLMLKYGKNRVTVTSQAGEQVKISMEARIEYASV
jgi:hypothetical protein